MMRAEAGSRSRRKCCISTQRGLNRGTLIVLALLTCAAGTRGHETDQYSVPTGQQFADLRFWFSEYMYDKIAGAVDATNQKIARTLRNGQPSAATAKAQSHDELAWTLLLEFPPVINYVETLEGQLRSSKMRSRYPGLVVSYQPAAWIYHHPMLLLDPTKLLRLGRTSTMMVNGSYFGTDKVVHFVHMGYLYFRAYRTSLAKGLSVEEATRRAINEGAGSGIISENNLLGYLPTGVNSNGDKVADYVGMKMYLNLTDPVMLKGSMRPPLLIRDGEFYKFNSHVRRNTDFFNVFVSDHWNEAFLPNTYGPGQARWVMEEVRKRCPAVLDFYRDESGRQYSKADFRRIAEELTTYYGEDYGFEGNLDEMVSIMTACFDGESEAIAIPRAFESNGQRDSLRRTPLWRAARAGRLQDVEPLVRTEQLNLADIDGETPLHAAVRGGDLGTVRVILRAGAVQSSANKHGATPLHLAAQNDALSIVEALIATGADVEARDEFGCTPLHDAARRGSASVVSLLLKSGAKPQTADNFGTTPLHRAARTGRVDVLRLLLAAGASSTASNSLGRTPVDEAKSSRNKEAIALLSAAESKPQAGNQAIEHRVLVSLPGKP
jgi:ankyrin repeat protein